MAANAVRVETDLLQRGAFGCALLTVVVLYSRICELGPLVPFRLVGVTLALAMITGLLAGGILKALREKVAWLLLAYTVWLVLAVPFSIWRGGSVDVVESIWSKSLLLFLVVSGAIANVQQFRLMLKALAFSLVFMAIYSLSNGSDSVRLMRDSGFFSNPNDLATIVVIGLPLWWYLIKSHPGKVGKIALTLCTLPMWIALGKTGSRGGMIGLLAVVLVLFFQSSLRRKAQVLVAAVVLLSVAMLTLPESLLRRYVTFFQTENGDPTDDVLSAAGSAESRKLMLNQSLRFTMEHPLFGLGPGNFRVASTDELKRQNLYAPWTDAHNTFTQISSEAGLPALGFYLAAIIVCWRALSRVQRSNPDSRASDAARYLKLSLVAFIGCGMFGNYAYQHQLPLLLALAMGLVRATSSGLVSVPRFRTVPASPPYHASAVLISPARATQHRYASRSGAGQRSTGRA